MSTIDHKSYLAVALPFVIATVTQPLLGAVVGRLGHVSHIGGVAIGTVMFNTLYWLFGFLRVSTSGYSSQALGTQVPGDMVHAYAWPLVMALAISLSFVLCRELILQGAIHIYHPDPEVAVQAQTYFRILIWGAPLVLVNYVNLGWLMGQKKVKEILFLQVSANVMNILLDLTFVFWFKMGVAGDSLGRQNLTGFRRTRQITDIYLGGICFAAVAALILFKGRVIQCFTNLEEIVALCKVYMVWITLYPITIGIGLVYYGFYTGTTHTAPVKNSMLISLGVLAGAYYTLVP